MTTRPKAREIHAADFADRVVHHLLVPRLEALFEPVFTHDSYSNRQGKGTHGAVVRLQTFMRRVSRNGKRRGWYLQLDIENFFNRIDRGALLSLLEGRLARSVAAGILDAPGADQLGWLCRTILAEVPGRNVVRRGPPESFGKVPPHKRLAEAPAGRGLPIGNLTSQFFANVYLNELDQFVKHRLKCRAYLRYVDDFVLLHEDPAVLEGWRKRIEEFLAARLGLALRDGGVLQPVSAGCDFLGYVVRPGYRLVRRRVIGHLRERLNRFEAELLRQGPTGTQLDLRKEPRERLRATLASYLGHCQHAASFRLRQALWRRYPWLGALFALSDSGVLRPRWAPASVTSLRSQWRYFARTAPEALVLMQTGNRAQAYEAQARRLSDLLRHPLDPTPRPGFAVTLSMPLSQLRSLRNRLRNVGIAHCFVAEEGYLRSGHKRRVLRLAWRPAAGENRP